MFKCSKLHQFASLFSNKFELVQNMFRHESHQFILEVLEIQDKSQHVCRIVSICIRETCLDMFDELHQFVSEVLEIQDKSQHVCRIVSIRIRETCLDMYDELYQFVKEVF